MIAPAVYTYRNPPPDPERDLWWQAQRIAVPDTDDWTLRHKRGAIRMPYDFDDSYGEVPAGQLVEAWVCCDPACGGVELSDDLLQMQHACCGAALHHGEPTYVGSRPQQRGLHRVGLGASGFRGYYHGEFTPWWEPVALAGGAR